MAGRWHRGRVLRCPACGRDVPEVLGAESQECPHCGEAILAARQESARVDATAGAVAALRVARKAYGAALLLWVPALVVDVAASMGISYYQASHGIPEDLAGITDAQRLAFVGVGAPILLATLLLKLMLFAPTAGLVIDRMDPRREAGSALAFAARAVFGTLTLALILLVLYLGGVVLALVGLVVFYHWFQFAPAAFADRAKGVGDALSASRRFAQERRAFGFTALSFFALLLAIILDLVINAAGTRVLDLVLPASWSDAIVGSLALWLVTPFLAILPAAYWTLATRAKPTDVSAPIEPDAPASARFRTTKCPQCGALIPYTATGAPVDVACPVCGRAGKVL